MRREVPVILYGIGVSGSTGAWMAVSEERIGTVKEKNLLLMLANIRCPALYYRKCDKKRTEKQTIEGIPL